MDCLKSERNCEFVVSRGTTWETGWLSKCVICQRLFPKDMVKCENCPLFAHERCILGAARVTIRPGSASPVAITTADAGTQTGRGDARCADAVVSVGTQTRAADVVACDVHRVEAAVESRPSPVAGDSTPVADPTAPAQSQPVAASSPAGDASTPRSPPTSRPRTAYSMAARVIDWISCAKPPASDENDGRPKTSPHHTDQFKQTFKSWEKRFLLFSRFDYGIMLNEESFQYGCPEILASYMAKKCVTFKTVVDPFCGAGENAIQLALIGRKVIAMDIDPLKILLAKKNAEVYGVAHRIDFRVADFFEIANDIDADVVVTSPPWDDQKHVKQPIATLDKNNSSGRKLEGIAEIVRLSRKIAPRVILNLPKTIDRDRCLKMIRGQGFSRIKLEKVSIDGLLNNYIFYLTQDVIVPELKSTPMVLTAVINLKIPPSSKYQNTHYLQTNKLACYQKYLGTVDEFIGDNKTS